MDGLMLILTPFLILFILIVLLTYVAVIIDWVILTPRDNAKMRRELAEKKKFANTPRDTFPEWWAG